MGEKKSSYRDTRGELIEAALKLIAKGGLESASVDAIIASARLSKGTFFHYFHTKEDLLDAACQRLAAEGWRAVKETLEGPGDPVEQLARYLAEGRRFRLARAAQVGGLWEALSKVPRLSVAVRERQRAFVGPALTRVIASGVAREQLEVDDPEIATELLLEFVDASAEGTMRLLRSGGPDAAQQAQRRVNATLAAIERILGIEAGVLERVDARTVQSFQKEPAGTPASTTTSQHENGGKP